MTGNPVTGADLAKFWLLFGANRCRYGAACAEAATGWRVGRGGYIAFQDDALALALGAGIWDGHC